MREMNNYSCIETFGAMFFLWLKNYPFANNKGSYLSLIKGKKVLLRMYLFYWIIQHLCGLSISLSTVIPQV